MKTYIVRVMLIIDNQLISEKDSKPMFKTEAKNMLEKRIKEFQRHPSTITRDICASSTEVILDSFAGNFPRWSERKDTWERYGEVVKIVECGKK